MGELLESPAWIVMHCASQPREKLPSSQIQRDMESLLFWTQKLGNVTSQGRFLNDKIFTRQIRTAPLQRQGASLWDTQYDDNTTSHVQPTLSPASRSILFLLYTAHWLGKWDTTPSSLASRIIYCWYWRKLSFSCPALGCPYSSELLPEVLRQFLLPCSPKRTFLAASYSWSFVAFLSHFIWSWLGTNKGELTALSSSWEKESWISCRGEATFCLRRTSVGRVNKNTALDR